MPACGRTDRCAITFLPRDRRGMRQGWGAVGDRQGLMSLVAVAFVVRLGSGDSFGDWLPILEGDFTALVAGRVRIL